MDIFFFYDMIEKINIQRMVKMRDESKKRDPLENFEAQFKKSTLPLMVMKILSEREMYAY